MSVKAQGAAALGIRLSGPYFPFIDNPQNQKFVAEFRKKYDRDPTFYAAIQYDTVMLMDAAIREVNGNTFELKEIYEKVTVVKPEPLPVPKDLNLNIDSLEPSPEAPPEGNA